jgi:NAD(P)-dependent dehydrogenase (short-subunit alcohol dehydrogenase family)
VGVGYREPRRILTEDGLPHVLAINVIAPYLLTALMTRPTRLVYLSSGMHQRVQTNLSDITWEKRTWAGSTAYAESKLYDVLLAFAISRRWTDVFSNALEPGWVATRMGGPGAPDDIDQAHLTQAWLAVSNDPDAMVTGQYFYHMRSRCCTCSGLFLALKRPSVPPPEGLLTEMLRKHVCAVPDHRP